LIKYAVLAVMGTVWMGFWAMITRSNLQEGDITGAVVIATLLLVIPAGLVIRRVYQVRETEEA